MRRSALLLLLLPFAARAEGKAQLGNIELLIINQTIFADVNAGEVINIAAGNTNYTVSGISTTVTSPDGTVTVYTLTAAAGLISTTTLPATITNPLRITANRTGVWRIRFDHLPSNQQNASLRLFDVTVTPNAATAVVPASPPGGVGRVWANSWSFCNYGGAFTSDFFVVSPAGCTGARELWDFDFEAMDGICWQAFSRSTGYGPPYLNASARATVTPGAALIEPHQDYPLYLARPAIPAVTCPALSATLDTPTGGACRQIFPGTGATFTFTTNRAGTYTIVIDTNRDGVFDPAVDPSVAGTASAGTNSATWNGKARDGSDVGPSGATPYSAQLSMRTAEAHFLLGDIEYNSSGIAVFRIDPATGASSAANMNWDDRYVVQGSVASDQPTPITTPPGGVVSTAARHRWGNSVGNNSVMDTYVHGEQTTSAALLTIDPACAPWNAATCSCNGAPIFAQPLDRTVAEGSVLTFALAATDPEGSALAFSMSAAPSFPFVNGPSLDPTSGAFAWTPDFDVVVGATSKVFVVTYSASDGTFVTTRTGRITVLNTNRAPMLAVGDRTATETRLLDFVAPASDPDGDPFTLATAGLPRGASFDPAAARLRWTPDLGQAGVYTPVAFLATDRWGLSTVELITITARNFDPVLDPIGAQVVLENDWLAFSISANDAEGAVFTAANLPEGASIAGADFRWQPTYEQAGRYTVTFSVSANDLTDSEDVEIEVVNVNRPPEVQPQTLVLEPGVAVVIPIDVRDADGDPVACVIEPLPIGAAFDDGPKSLRWTPVERGTFTLLVRCTDGVAQSGATLDASVGGGASAPGGCGCGNGGGAPWIAMLAAALLLARRRRRASATMALMAMVALAPACGDDKITSALPHLIAPERLDFGTVAAGAQAILALPLQNDGTGALEVRSLEVSAGEFAVVERPERVPGGEMREAFVQFRPTGDGARLGTLIVTTNDSARTVTTVALAGRASGPPPCGATCSPDACPAAFRACESGCCRWVTSTVDAPGDVGMHSSVRLDAGGRPRITYFDASQRDLKYARWNGLSWEVSTVDAEGDVGWYSSLAVDAAGVPHVTYYDGTRRALKYARLDGGAWAIALVDGASDAGWHSSLTLDASGAPRVTTAGSTSRRLKYARWTGSAWSIAPVDSASVVNASSLALDASGGPRIAYTDSRTGALRFAAWVGSSWVISPIDPSATAGEHVSLALDGAGKPHLSYVDTAGHDLKHAAWSGSAWSITVVDLQGDVGNWSALALGGDGKPQVAYYDGGGLDLKYASWTGSAWIVSTVDAAGEMGWSTSLALDAAGNPHITYYDLASKDLRYAR